MNSNEIQNEISNIIEANRQQIGGRNARKQYPASKHQIATLTELGIIEYMPNAPYAQHIGHSDAKAVIAAAQDSGKGSSTDALSDDPSTYPASKLYTLLNEIEDEPIGGGDEDIHVGDYVTVEPHAIYRDLHVNASYTPMWTVQHNGYKHVRVSHLFNDELGGTIVEVEVGGMIDEIPLQFCKKA